MSGALRASPEADRDVDARIHFDLTHLAPRAIACQRPDGLPPMRISVAFSHHCYTVRLDAGAGGLRVVERGDARLFDVERWELSRAHLAGMVEALPMAVVEDTWEQRNYRFAIRAAVAGGRHYQMFFGLRRAEGPDADLRLFVESAYPIPPASRPKGPGVIRFAVLAMKVLRGDRIGHPPRR